jgi:predicted ATP-grasp superfamily ATP-dependent carboligase
MLVTSDPHGHACHSRSVSELVVAPDPAKDSEGLLEVLMEKGWSGALLVPTLDEYLIFVSQNKADLERRFVFAVPDWEVEGRIVNKNLLYPLAREAGVPAPAFLLPKDVSSLESWQDPSHYPCILKPYESRRFSLIYGSKVLVARDFEDLVAKYVDTQANHLDVMVSEIIPGDDSTIRSYRCYIDSTGEVLGELCAQKLRQYPVGFGQASVARPIPMVEEIRDSALRLLRLAGYRGYSNTEFRLDSRDGRYKLMEINTRPLVTEWLGVAAGINFPYITYRDIVDDVREAPASYDTDITWIHNHWEMVTFIQLLRAGRMHPKEFFAPYGKKRVYVVPFWEDPVHFLSELYRNSGLASKRIRGHRAG